MRIGQIIASIVVVSWMMCIDVSPSWASADTVDTVIVEKPIHSYVLYLGREPAQFTFKGSPIFTTFEPEDWPITLDVAATADALTLVPPKPGTGESWNSYLLLVTTRFYVLQITVLPARLAKKPSDIKTAIEVAHKSQLILLQLAAERLAMEKFEQAKTKLTADSEAKFREYEQTIERLNQEHATTEAHSTQVALLNEVYTEAAPACRGTGIQLCDQIWTPLASYGVLRFVVDNRTSQAVEFSSLEAIDERGTSNHASMVRVGDAAPVSSDQLNARLESMQRVVMSVLVRDPESIGSTVELSLRVAGRAMPMIRTVELYPKPPQPKEGEGRITVGVHGIAGAVWLANPIEPTKLGATTTTGLGVGFRYDFNRRWAFEGEIAGARSGDASFDGMMFNGEEGEVFRNASLGRVIGGGRLQAGTKYRPFMRLGVGFQGVRHGSRFRPTGGAEQDGPEVDFEVGGLWMVGLGLDAELGEHWTAGIGTMFVRATSLSGDGTSGSLEGGLHLSYGWTPR